MQVSDQCNGSAESQKYIKPGAQNLMFAWWNLPKLYSSTV